MAESDDRNARRQERAEAESYSDGLFMRIFKGEIVPYHFFRKHYMLVSVCIAMVLMSIANKYSCQGKITEIKHLEKELTVAQANRVDASARYNSLIRESSMKRLVDTMHIDLISPESPSYKLR